MGKNEIATVTPTAPTLVLEGNPRAQMEFAIEASQALMGRIKKKPKALKFSGKEYLEIGDWQTVARFFGATVGSDWSRPIERDGAIIGYEARAVVWQRGDIISAGEAMCLRSEKNWAKREEFQLRSMAQTRAASKALRNALGWVPELAGYSSTPWEEVQDMAEGEYAGEPEPGPKKDVTTRIVGNRITSGPALAQAAAAADAVGFQQAAATDAAGFDAVEQATSAAAAQGLTVEDMAREAAKRGREQLLLFFNNRSAADKAKLRKIEPELIKLYPQQKEAEQ